ncbi:unnamed protein product [Pedinophyceae sp. YPF-701]|nr:unnamed protein product [Pedinophyceae sp. YPF-701]
MSSWWTSLFGSAQGKGNRFSLEELQRLHQVLMKNPTVTEANQDVLVETLRSTAELMIWGDQHNAALFDYFLEHNMLAHFHSILSQRSNQRHNNLVKQVLQTLAIMIQNIRSEHSLFFLFSNNHLNHIIGLTFDFQDEELLGFYISLLKTISLKLTENTVQFFFNSGASPHSPHAARKPHAPAIFPPGGGASATDTEDARRFPLYSRGSALFDHPESMVRAAVRTLTLQVFRLRDDGLSRFVARHAAGEFFPQLAAYLAGQAVALDGALAAAAARGAEREGRVDDLLAELEDVVVYCNDVLSQATEEVGRALRAALWRELAGPVLFWPLLAREQDGAEPPAGSTTWRRGDVPAVRPATAMYVLERLLQSLTDPGLLNALACSLLLGHHTITYLLLNRHNALDLYPPRGTADQQAAHKPFECYRALLDALGSGNRLHSAGATRVLVALLRNTQVDTDLLDTARLLPQRMKKTRDLIHMLQNRSHGARSLVPSEPSQGSRVSGEGGREGSYGRSEYSGEGEGGDDVGPMPRQSMDVDALLGAVVHMHLDVSSQKSGQGGGVDGGAADAASSGDEGEKPADGARKPRTKLSGTSPGESIVGDLFKLLGGDLPCHQLALVGWLLRQLLTASKGGRGRSKMGDEQRAWLDEAVPRAADDVGREVEEGLYGDAVPLMVHLTWRPCRLRVVSPALPGTSESLLLPVSGAGGGASGKEGSRRGSRRSGSAGRNASRNGTDQQAGLVERCTQRVQALVTLAQVHQLLSWGRVRLEAPLAGTPSVPRPDLREGVEVPLANLSPLKCKVSFEPSVEQGVLLFTAGLAVQPGMALVDAPLTVLAAPSQSRADCGRILCTAPVLGCRAEVDRGHPSWLHLGVRPPLRHVARALNHALSSPSGHVKLRRDFLADGHWVLAFGGKGEAAAAVGKIADHGRLVRGALRELLAPLLRVERYAGWGREASQARVSQDGDGGGDSLNGNSPQP